MSRIAGIRMDGQRIRSLRGERAMTDPYLPYGWFNEKERSLNGTVDEVSTILLTNRECPYSCLMCDLWKHTTTGTVDAGAIPEQIEFALKRLPPARQLKLYNGGSFFDPGAIPVKDYPRIASLSAGFENLLVESHPAFIGERCLEFSRMLEPVLQVAIGLETVHPEVLPLLNKGMTLEDFSRAVALLRANGITVRAFILLRPPFLSEEEGVEWACRSIDFAFDCGVNICSVIPVRAGNGALDHLAAEGFFHRPSIHSLERVTAYGTGLKRGVVLADLWDLEIFSGCDSCFEPRKERLTRMNLTQEPLEPVRCTC